MIDIQEFKPGSGTGVLRSYDGGLVLSGHFAGFPAGRVKAVDYGIFIFCTAGKAQFDYDGQAIQLFPGDLFLFFAHAVMENFMCSPDFECREVWFSRGEMWDMNMYSKNSLADLVALKQYPKVVLDDADAVKLGTYFQLLSQNLRDSERSDNREIVHSLFSTFLLEALAMLRRGLGEAEPDAGGSRLHGKVLADKFVELVEQSDGRVRRVEEFAAMLNVTPKYLSRILMKTMHRKPSVIVALFTLKAIENRLRYTDLTMQQIADDLHFSSASSFGKFVKEHTGMTPLEFRQKYQQNK